MNQEIAALRSKEAGEVKKAADAQKKINSALDSARRTTSPSLAKNYLSTAERETRNLQKAQENQSRYSSQAAAKSKTVADLQGKISKEEERERKKAEIAEEKRRRDEQSNRAAEARRRRVADEETARAAQAMQQRITELEEQVAAQLEAKAAATSPFRLVPPEGEVEAFDVFISHASEDKQDFVDDLAKKAREAGLRVWYDRFALTWGDSIRQKIDAGLAGSYFGIVVLSPSFFAKNWTQYELDGLLEKALSGTGRLLPIWHKLSKDEVAKHAPSMVGRLALNTSFLSAEEIVAELKILRDRYRENESSVPEGTTGG
ncbi:toll/interleukin-1 receptor domain-containing protein [Devosia sp. XK-2]|uniref:toll/interleukin-1 receptor domain-containing protein n=1 Tax=Devosia sp. XK-2 TaxID=3126689 RepID=UPI0030D4F466